MKVLKFGGTSVKNYEAIDGLYQIVKSNKDNMVIVVSAMAGVTNTLLALSESKNKDFINDKISLLLNRHIVVVTDLGLVGDKLQTEEFVIHQFALLKMYIEKNLNLVGQKRHYDQVVSFGEVLSSYIVNSYFVHKGLDTTHLDSRELIITDNEFSSANVLLDVTKDRILKKIEPYTVGTFDSGKIFVAGGFIASSIDKNPTTLGRGGSDFTASLYAAMLNADVLEIWTDVDGILTCDPRLVPEAKLITHLSYLEAAELAFFGAKVLHPKTILPAVNNKIPVVVKNTFNPNDAGTAIYEIENNPKMIKAIAFRKNITVINIISNRMLGAYGFLSNVFEVFKEYKTSVDLVATSEVSISLTIDNDSRLAEIVNELEGFANVSYSHNNAIISVVGEGIKRTSGIAAKFFGVLSDINVFMVSVGASEVNLSIIVSQDDMENAVKRVHKEFFEISDLDSDIFKKINK